MKFLDLARNADVTDSGDLDVSAGFQDGVSMPAADFNACLRTWDARAAELSRQGLAFWQLVTSSNLNIYQTSQNELLLCGSADSTYFRLNLLDRVALEIVDLSSTVGFGKSLCAIVLGPREFVFLPSTGSAGCWVYPGGSEAVDDVDHLGCVAKLGSSYITIDRSDASPKLYRAPTPHPNDADREEIADLLGVSISGIDPNLLKWPGLGVVITYRSLGGGDPLFALVQERGAFVRSTSAYPFGRCGIFHNRLIGRSLDGIVVLEDQRSGAFSPVSLPPALDFLQIDVASCGEFLTIQDQNGLWFSADLQTWDFLTGSDHVVMNSRVKALRPGSAGWTVSAPLGPFV